MLHLYQLGAKLPVCGVSVPRGDLAREYNPPKLCPGCSAWRVADVERIKRKYGLSS